MNIVDLTLPKENDEPVSVQLAGCFREAISNRKFRPNQKLPTTKQIVSKFGVSTHTVREAMSILCSEGLVNMTPRKGTFVNYNFGMPPRKVVGGAGGDKQNILHKLNAGTKLVAGRTVGIFGLVNHDSPLGDWGMFRVDSTRGILTECDKQGLVAMNMPEYSDMNVQQYIDMAKYYNADGIIWCRQDRYELINKFMESGIPSVLICRDKPQDFKFAAVSPDYYGAGTKVASMIRNSSVNSKAIIVHIKYRQDIDSAYSNRFFGGLRSSGSNEPVIDLDIGTWEINQIREMLDWIKSKDSQIPVIFMCSYHLIGLLMNFKEETQEVLGNRRIFAISNREPNMQLLSCRSDLNPYIIFDDYSKLSSIGIQKLVTLMSGLLDNTSTTLEMHISPLNDFNIVSNDFFELK